MPDEDAPLTDEVAVLAVLTIDDLSAYVDGEVTAEVAQDVQKLIEEDPRAARWYAAYRYQVGCMHRAFGTDLDETPARMTGLLRASVEPRRST